MIYLYVKTHEVTGLKYFGKTTRDDPISYRGSGKYWNRHLQKHGAMFTTEIIASFDDPKECEEYAIKFSIDNNIVESESWANLREENGLDGAPVGHVTKEETKVKISQALLGKSSPKNKYVLREDRNTRSKRMSENTKDTFWVNNGVVSKRVRVIEEGWVLGRLDGTSYGDKNLGSRNKSGNNTRGKVIYNNGKEHKYFIEGEQPEGWVRGKMKGFQGGTGSLKKGKKYGK